jgi:hypothetical protein
MKISQATIEQAKQKIIEVISNDVQLKRNGSGFVGLCPFHDEKTPSFHVKPAELFFKCFGCDASGDAITYIEKKYNKSFAESVEFICNNHHINLEQDESNKPQERKQKVIPAIETLPVEDLPASTVERIGDNPLTARIAGIVGERNVLLAMYDYKIAIHQNSVTYPEIDTNGKFRAAKTVFVDSDGNRVKDGRLSIPQWQKPATMTQCLTGLHLIKPHKTVGIVEGSSTLLFMAALTKVIDRYNINELQSFKNIVWLSTQGMSNIDLTKPVNIEALKGCSVVLYPDAGAYDNWRKYADEMNKHGVNTKLSSFLEDYYKQGLIPEKQDLRDVFMNHSADELRGIINPERLFDKWLEQKKEGGKFYNDFQPQQQFKVSAAIANSNKKQ